MKEDFGWEVPYELVPIPSKGVIYDPNSDLYCVESVQIKAMTAKEEDILASQALLKQGSVVTNLIKSCVVNTTFDPVDMISGDRNALMVSIRITGYGPEYAYTSECENCSEKNKNTAKLDELGINRLKIEPIELGKNEFKFTLPVTKKKITFKFLTDRDDKDRAAASKFASKHLETKVEKATNGLTGNAKKLAAWKAGQRTLTMRERGRLYRWARGAGISVPKSLYDIPDNYK